jgi:hypothetical protein
MGLGTLKQVTYQKESKWHEWNCLGSNSPQNPRPQADSARPVIRPRRPDQARARTAGRCSPRPHAVRVCGPPARPRARWAEPRAARIGSGPAPAFRSTKQAPARGLRFRPVTPEAGRATPSATRADSLGPSAERKRVSPLDSAKPPRVCGGFCRPARPLAERLARPCLWLMQPDPLAAVRQIHSANWAFGRAQSSAKPSLAYSGVVCSTNLIRVSTKSIVLGPRPHVELPELRASVELPFVRSYTSLSAPRALRTCLDHYVSIPDHTYRVLDPGSDSLAYRARVLGPRPDPKPN